MSYSFNDVLSWFYNFQQFSKYRNALWKIRKEMLALIWKSGWIAQWSRRKNDTTYLIFRYLQLYHLSKIYLTYLIDLGVCPNSASWSTSICGLRKINHWRVLLFYPLIVFFHSDRGQPRGLSDDASSTDLKINGRFFYWYLSDSITPVGRQWGGICKINNS